MSRARYELTYDATGVLITEYDVQEDGSWTVVDKQSYEWTDVFRELTGEKAAPDVV